jgi:hypothetical protein
MRPNRGAEVLPRRFWLPVALLLAIAACRDAAAPLDGPSALAEVVATPWGAGPHILQQGSTAPALETYQVSFWARRDRASTAIVNYQPAAGQSVGDPFLRFVIPKDGLRTGGAGAHLHGHRDSVLITLTINPVDFSVAFEPSGVRFSGRRPATLAVWYGNANPDLNGDGVVDAADDACAEQLAIWGRPAKPAPWMKTLSKTLTGQQWVVGAIRHFSEYAVSW